MRSEIKKLIILKKILQPALFLFCTLFIITLPFGVPGFPTLPRFIFSGLENFYGFMAREAFGWRNFESVLASDSPALYFQLFFLLIISTFIAALHFVIRRKPLFSKRALEILTMCFAYYLCLHLLVYGFSKIFDRQFYLPEANTLFTKLGDIPRDLLYWSSMGTNRNYVILTGAAEICAGALLVFRKTRLFGALLSFLLILNITAINFSYDIGVKLLSSFLLLLNMIILRPAIADIFTFFNRNKTQQPVQFAKKKFRYVIKIAAIFLIGFIVLSPYLSKQNTYSLFRKQRVRNAAYEVVSFSKNNLILPPLLTDTIRWRRIFFHSHDYFIVQQMNDEMKDFELLNDTATKTFILTEASSKQDYFLSYEYVKPDCLQLAGIFKNDTLTILLKAIDLKKLPVLQEEFHWTE